VVEQQVADSLEQLGRQGLRHSLLLLASWNVDTQYLFEPISVETVGIIIPSACHFLNDLDDCQL